VALFALGQGGDRLGADPDGPARAGPERSAELFGMAQVFGYSLAIGPFAIGALYNWSGGWEVPLAALLAMTLPLLAAGVAAGRRAWNLDRLRSIVK